MLHLILYSCFSFVGLSPSWSPSTLIFIIEIYQCSGIYNPLKWMPCVQPLPTHCPISVHVILNHYPALYNHALRSIPLCFTLDPYPVFYISTLYPVSVHFTLYFWHVPDISTLNPIPVSFIIYPCQAFYIHSLYSIYVLLSSNSCST